MNYVVCIKSGDKYGPEYVNVLFNMVKRNLSIDFKFVCFTDNKAGINVAIQTYDLPFPGLNGWWNKLALFSKNLPISGTILFLDLDVVIIKNIDCLFNYKPREFIILQDYGERINKKGFRLFIRRILKRIKGESTFGSAIFRFETNNNYMIWQRFIDNKEEIVKKYRGDQDWITECVRYKARIWPYTWCMSYKWEFAGDFDKSRPPECYRPKKRIKVPKDLRIVVFHGKPNPEDVLHNSVIKNNYL